MAKSSRDKGRRGELEFAKRYGGRRINDEGLAGPDVAIRTPTQTFNLPSLSGWEIKRPARVAAIRYYEQAKAEGADYLAFREDRNRTWFIIHPVTEPCPCPLTELEADATH